jgi:hypothetical protein
VALVLSALGVFGISYGFMVALSSWAIVPDRWFPFGLTLAAIPASYAILSLVNLGKKRPKIRFVCILVFVIAFFSITSSLANDDSPLYTRAGSISSFTSAELRSATLLSAVRVGAIVTDGYCAQNLFNQTLNHGHLGKGDLKFLQTSMLDGSVPIEGLVIIRTSGFSAPVVVGTGGTYAQGAYSPYFYVNRIYDRSFMQELISQGNVLYSSQSVVAIEVPR